MRCTVSKIQRLEYGWFVGGILLAFMLLMITPIRDLSILLSDDSPAGLILLVLATVEFGIIMPIACVFFRFHREEYNFFQALLFLVGFTVGAGLVIAWNGAYLLALAYVVLSTALLAILYRLTHALHNRIERIKKDPP